MRGERPAGNGSTLAAGTTIAFGICPGHMRPNHFALQAQMGLALLAITAFAARNNGVDGDELAEPSWKVGRLEGWKSCASRGR